MESSRAGQLIDLGGGDHRYDLSVTSTVTTLKSFSLNYFGANCNVTFNSANGTTPTWRFNASLGLVFDANFLGQTRISPSNQQLTGIESADYALSGDFLCTFAGAFVPASVLEDQFAEWFANYSFCAVQGPPYLGPCPLA